MAGVAASGQFASTSDVALRGCAGTASPAETEETIFGTPLSDLSKPELWKHEQNGLDVWEKLVAHAAADKFPDEADTFRPQPVALGRHAGGFFEVRSGLEEGARLATSGAFTLKSALRSSELSEGHEH